MKRRTTKLGKIAVFLVLLFLPICMDAQINFFLGGNLCYIRDNNILPNQHPILAQEFGLSVKVVPFSTLHQLSLETGLIYAQKGYQQSLDKDYIFRFNYFSIPLLVNYTPAEFIDITGGLELSGLFTTNIKEGTNTYNNTDAGLIFGLNFFQNRNVSLFTRMDYGLAPMLHYYTFDKLGNFTGKFSGLYNMCFTLGLRFKIYDNEIHLYK